MASSTTYGDWMRRIPGGIRNIGMPLTIAGFGVAVLALLVSTFNPLAGIAVAAAGVGAIAVLAVRDRRHRNVVDRMTERRAMREARRTGRGLYRSGFLGVVDGGETSLPGVLSRVGPGGRGRRARPPVLPGPPRAYRRVFAADRLPIRRAPAWRTTTWRTRTWPPGRG